MRAYLTYTNWCASRFIRCEKPKECQMSSKSYLLSRGWLFQILVTVLLIVPVNAFAQTPSSASPSPQAQPTPSLERRFFKNILRANATFGLRRCA